MIVTDANQLVYLYVRGGALTDRVDAVYRRDGDWAAPYLWRSEVRNALAQMIRDRKITMDEACAILAHAETLLKNQEYLVASPDVLALAIQSGCTAYDCEYVALAEALDGYCSLRRRGSRRLGRPGPVGGGNYAIAPL